jgi:hypothetical protein
MRPVSGIASTKQYLEVGLLLNSNAISVVCNQKVGYCILFDVIIIS